MNTNSDDVFFSILSPRNTALSSKIIDRPQKTDQEGEREREYDSKIEIRDVSEKVRKKMSKSGRV